MKKVKQKKNENLIWYFMKYLLLIIILLALTESLVSFFCMHIMYPFMMRTFHLDMIELTTDYQASSMITFRLMIALMCYGIEGLLPGELGGVVQYLENHMVGRVFHNQVGNAAAQMESSWTITLLVLFILLMLFLYIIPYMIAIFAYGRVVVVKVNQLKMEEAEKQKAAEKKRNLLLSDMAHDLKTPMTTIYGYAQALRNHMVEEPEKQEQYLDSIIMKSTRMNEMINMMLDYVRLDSEGFQLKKQKENLTELLLQTAANLYPEIEQAGDNLTVNISDEAVYAMIDKMQFTRVITNLITNAIRHNEKGTEMELAMQVYGNDITIRLEDNGAPIEEELKNHIFEPFVLGDASRNSKGGSGLGLSIAASVMELHEGSIRLEQPCKGNKTKAFVITLTSCQECCR